ncbi:MAG: hypothetical protein GTN80_01835 [Nitrososphaeria archaeon]|nr:hypothetical protein [Nitrososphaeria archaeon]NIQ32378.1 hypothetical protein [Nitrososphaeria archaeon]
MSNSDIEIFKTEVENVLRSHKGKDTWKICQRILSEARRTLTVREYVALRRYIHQRVRGKAPLRMKRHGWANDPILKALDD